ncbi:hypothetical protein M9Y10_044639 [Tritrichomonas musculus]|uniref:Uncharacterized protein n=1 Tax=Tritrichomonas musculus TaxID=1915356 RepID=A0ABR2JSX4_9EUKA
MQENNPRPNNNIVQVHLVVHQKNEDIKIDFDFNKLEDNIDTVVSELIETLGMTESDKEMIKASIEQQINPPKPNSVTHTDPYFEPICENQPSDQSDDTSDDADISDPDYRSLIEQQKRDMDALLANHLNERRELAQRIQASMLHQQKQQQQQQQQQQLQQQQLQQQQLQQQPQQQQQQQQQPQPQAQPNSVQPNPPLVIPTGQQTQQTPSASPIPIAPSTNPPTLCDDLIDF